MNAGVGGNSGPDVDADGGGVDELYMGNAFCGDGPDVFGQLFAVYIRIQRGNQAFQHHGGFAGSGYAGDDGQPSLGKVRFQRLDRVNLRCGETDVAEAEQFFF